MLVAEGRRLVPKIEERAGHPGPEQTPPLPGALPCHLQAVRLRAGPE